MTPSHPLEIKLAALWPPESWCDLTVLAAVSGGPDSVAMLRAMTALKTGGEGRICVAHFNHHLRGGESVADEDFVVDLCRRLRVHCEVGHAAEGPRGNDPDMQGEEVARARRYEFIEDAAARLGARYVVTAHTADDQAETILHRILRGTGVGGLAGMARARPLGPAATLIRPLLPVRRAELTAYLDDLGQSYRCDASNTDTRFTRNRIRHELLPMLAEQFNSGVVEALLRLGTLAGEVQQIVDAAVDDLEDQYVSVDGPDTVRLDAAGLAGQPRHAIRELLMAVWRSRDWPMQAMGFAQWDLLAEMMSAGGETLPSKQTLPGNVAAELTEGRLQLSRTANRTNQHTESV